MMNKKLKAKQLSESQKDEHRVTSIYPRRKEHKRKLKLRKKKSVH